MLARTTSAMLGTAQDVSYLIDFLPSYLFPAEERTISQWLVVGKSLGGHSAWLTLRNGCPDYLTLISKRAKAHSLPFGPPYIPKSLADLIKQADPAAAPYTTADASNPFLGKKILVLSGKDDRIVPWSASKDFVENLNVGAHGVKKVVVHPGVGHECTDEMVQEMAAFIWNEALI
ncbi:hypothetical protein A0H81_07458 [Grifola frondosa]|uniref:Peptidase S9 prolyl oligopeptidase catalytic domain-containing protein n=1 Tax=Grifola frondosa TaxID=5627 RepID=A0A1C7M7S5_GRIFR|nr:hypothetical protein A0H81_07458 [Grifola frondosa]